MILRCVAGAKFHISFHLRLGGTKMLAKKCLLVGIVTLLSLSLAISAQPVHPTTGEPLVIDCLRGTPDAIDGDLSDWNLEAMTPAVLDVVEQLNSGQDSWDGPEDCGGEFYLLWDDENIYIAAVVKDDKLSMNKSGGDIWNADCIEVLFSTTDADAAHSWTNPTIHYQYGFNANNQKYNWCNMDGPGQSEPDYLQIASSITADGYICEVSIPHSEITPLDWSVGSILGFHPCIDDTDIDNGDTEFQMTWSGIAAHDQSLGFEHMILSADSASEPAEPEPADPFLQADDADGIVSMEAERFHDNVAQGDHTWDMVTATEGFTGLVGMQALPNSGDNVDTGYVDGSPRLDFQITFVKTGTHYVWVRAWGSGGSDDSLHAGLDGQVTDSADRIDGFSGDYTWTNHTRDPDPATIDITDVGVHTLNLYMREDGALVDKIVLTTNPDYVPEGDGPAESPGGGSGPVKAFAPIPEDGAIEVDPVTLEWIPGYTAASNKVYLSEDETIDDADLAGETQIPLIAVTLTPGTDYYWRVDAVEADGTVVEGDVWTFATLAIEAHFPSPEDGATEVADGTQLSWTAGKGAILHNVSFGMDPAAMLPVSMMQMDTSYDPGPLEPFTTYYWKVDEFAGIATNPGPVWSFSTPNYLIISDDELTLDYDNSAEPFLSELALDTPADLTEGGVSGLTLKFHGGPGSGLSLDEATGTYTITGAGADIWNLGDEGNRHDEFHYVYRELTGDGSMTVRVTDNGTGSNLWAKGGVMIRQNATGGSSNVLGAITGGEGDGGTFQWREVQGQDSGSSRTLTGIAPPYWVRLTRLGNDFTCEMSADGVTWELEGDNPHTVEMTDPVLIGLAVTSHQAGELRTYTFDNVSTTGNVTGNEISTDIGGATSGNSPEPIYVALEDSSGAVAVVTHGNPEATSIDQWIDWTIPLSEFAGVDLTAATKLYIGVGDGAPGGSGTIRIDDIRVVKTVVFDFETDAQGWGGLKDGIEPTVSSETSAGGSQSLRVTIDEAAHGQQIAGWTSPRVFTDDDAVGGLNTLSFWYHVDDPDLNGGNFELHWIMSTESWSGGGWYGNGVYGVLIADGQWHQQTVDLSILGDAGGGWQGVWGDQTAWDFRDDLLYSFEIGVSPTDNTNGSNIYVDDVVFK